MGLRHGAWVASVACLLGGCAPVVELPEGRFTCQAAADCPKGWACRSDLRCWSTPGLEQDGGQHQVDSGRSDGGLDAGLDAGADGGSDPVDASAVDASAMDASAMHDGSTARCGDGLVAPAEDCDDGDDVPGDGCTACMVDEGYVCAGEPSSCADVDECADGTASCPEDSSCRNVEGGYECPCNCGFLPDGSSCRESAVVWPESHRSMTFDRNLSFGANTMRAFRVHIGAPTRIVRFEAETNTFGVNVQVGLYRDEAGIPGALVEHGGVAARSPANPSVIGTTRLPLSGCVMVEPGDYWLVWNQAANLSFRAAGTLVQLRSRAAPFSSSLPDRLENTLIWESDFFDAVHIDVISE